ncbi:hypothetical protein [Nonomuraea maheshkhaliensis]|uniref:RNA polymerase sigma factor n=1 Tax=Nonomuraea maheshkhaliensis TaxID=419590 RepID=UPI0031F87C2B
MIAELYDRYAAGLFAYCADQLGDLGSASDVLVTVLTSVPATVPPRAAIYAFARREIHRRNITYSPPAVDPLIDPATALVERSLRELRPHHREVLVLCAVCGLSKSELAWVLDVAPDTAEELAVGAGHRFRRALGSALASAGARLPKPVADVFGALKVAPLNDVLGRLPWPQPPGAVRIHFAGSRTAAPGPMFVKPRWPSPPVWPQPLAEADPATSTVIFPQELLTPPASSRVSPLEETTTPMPKLYGRRTPGGDLPLRDPLGSTRPFRDVLDSPGIFGDALSDNRPSDNRPSDNRRSENRLSGNRPSAPGAGTPVPERPFFMAPPEASAADPFATGDVILPKDAPDPYMTGDVLVHSERLAPQPAEFRQPPAPMLQRTSPPDEAAPLFQPRPKPATGRAAEPAIRPASGPAEWPGDVLSDEPPLGFARGPAAKPADKLVSRSADGPPAARSAAGPGLRPVAKPEARPAAKPATRSGAKPGAKPSGKPGAKPAEEPVYRLPGRRDEPGRETPKRPDSLLAPRPVRARPVPKRRPDDGRPPKMVRRKKDHHYDWIWEAVGFLLCVAIAMIVFFSMPIFTSP